MAVMGSGRNSYALVKQHCELRRDPHIRNPGLRTDFGEVGSII